MVFPRKRVLGAIVLGCILTALTPLATQADDYIYCDDDGCSTWFCDPGICYDTTRSSVFTTTSPISGSLRTNLPTIRWTAVENATAYNIRIVDSRGTEVFETQAGGNDTQQQLPPTHELERGQNYTLTVEAVTPDRAATFESEIYVISAAELQALDAIAQDLGLFEQIALYQNLSPELDIRQPLYTDALELLLTELEREPDNLNHILLLGDLYWQAVLPDIAEQQYLKIIEAQPTNAFLLAQAQVGLARVALDRNQTPTALAFLQQAKANFDRADDPNSAFFLAQTLQFLAEIYDRNDDAETARQFYQQALAAYQAVEPDEPLSQADINRFINVINEDRL